MAIMPSGPLLCQPRGGVDSSTCGEPLNERSGLAKEYISYFLFHSFVYSLYRIFDISAIIESSHRFQCLERTFSMPDALRLFKANIFQAMSHPTRIAIVEVLRDGELPAGVII